MSAPARTGTNDRGEHLLSLVDHSHAAAHPASACSTRSSSCRATACAASAALHATQRDLGNLPGIGRALIDYVPGESTTGLFGGNSNWRGPIWMPTNYSLVQALEKFHRFLGDRISRSPCPAFGRTELNLQQIATLIAERLSDLYRRDGAGEVPALRRDSPFQNDPHWADQFFFYEYFHGETGQGLGAAHQTGWTGLIANLVMRRYQKDITPWSGLDRSETASPIDEIA